MNPTDRYAKTKNVNGAISSPNRYSSGIARKIAANTRLSMPSHHTRPPSVSWKIPNDTEIKAPITAAILRIRRRLPTVAA